MKKGLKIFSVASAFVLLVGGAVALAKQDKKQALQTKAAVDTTSYTMTAGELLGSLERFNNCTGVVTDDNLLRLTTIDAGQFHFFTKGYSSNYNFNRLSADCTSMTVKLRISSAEDFAVNSWVRYYEGTTVDNYIPKSIDLAAAAAGFVDMVYERPDDAQYFDAILFLANAADAVLDIESITFNGLTSFGTSRFIKLQPDWNHLDKGGGYHACLFEYLDDFGITTGNEVEYAEQLGDKVTLNGVSFRELKAQGAKINHQHGAKYLQFIYPDSAMATSDEYPVPVLQIHDVIFFENTFIEPTRVQFNSTTSKWEVKNLVSEEPLVMNSDYVLYTSDSYDFGGGHDGWFFYTKDNEPMTELTGHQNFGFQFKMQTVDDGTGSFDLKFGSSITAMNFMLVRYSNGNICIPMFKNIENYDDIANKTRTYYDLADNQEHLVEVYVIKDSANTVTVICGFDGIRMFKVESLDISDAVEWNYIALYDYDLANKLLVDSCETTNTTAIEKFFSRKLASYSAPYMDAYADANTYMNTYLTPSQRDAFENSSAYASIYSAYRLLRAEAINEYAAPKKTELENYIADLSIYTTDDQATIADIITAGKDAMSRATSYEQVDEILVEYKALLDEVPTAAERLVEYKAAAKAELDSYLDEDDYLPADWDIAEQWIQNGKDNIDLGTDFNDVDQMLETYKANLDTIPTKADRQQELEEAKAAGKAEIAAYKADVVYREEQQQQRTEIVERHSSLIDNITQYSGIGQIAVEVEAAKEAIDALPTKAELDLQDAKDAAYAQLNAIDPQDYYQEQRQQVNAIINEAEEAIDAAASIESVNSILADALAEIAEIPTGAQVRAADVDALIDAIGEVTHTQECLNKINAAAQAYQALDDAAKAYVTKLSVLQAAISRFNILGAEYYISLIPEEITPTEACFKAIGTAYTFVATYLTEEEMAQVSNIDVLLAAMDAYAEVLDAAQAAAIARIQEFYDSLNLKKYSAENKELLEQLKNDAIAAIQDAKWADDFDATVEAYIAASEEVPQKKAPAKKGCGGSIVATSIVLSTLALAGLGLAISKKRKED